MFLYIALSWSLLIAIKELLLTISEERTLRDIRQITYIFIGENVEFILVVEKDTIYNLLWQAKFHEKHNCLIITRHGMPDERTISFVRMLEEKIDVPIFSIIDLDAYESLIIKNICDSIQWVGTWQFQICSNLHSLARNLHNWYWRSGLSRQNPLKQNT